MSSMLEEYARGLSGVATGSGMNQLGLSDRERERSTWSTTDYGCSGGGTSGGGGNAAHESAVDFAESWSEWIFEPFDWVAERTPRSLRWALRLALALAVLAGTLASGVALPAAAIAAAVGGFGLAIIRGLSQVAVMMVLYLLYMAAVLLLGVAFIAACLGLLYAVVMAIGFFTS
ncbi:MAG: hypothetical protein AAGJ46_07810 [Planctomycetota bacterium]